MLPDRGQLLPQFLDFSVFHITHVWAFQITEQRRSNLQYYFPNYRTGKLIPAREGIGPVCVNVYYSRTMRAFDNHLSGAFLLPEMCLEIRHCICPERYIKAND